MELQNKLTLEKVLNTDIKELKEIVLLNQLLPDEVKKLHKEYFNVYPREIGMLGLCTPFDYSIAYIKAIKRNIKYDEKKYLRSEGWSEEEINNTIWG